MRLEIETPRSVVIVINGQQVSIPGLSAADQQQLALTPMTAMFTEFGAMFGGSAATLRKHFDVSAAPADGAIEVTLSPTVPEWQRLFRTIALRFAGPDLLISSMRLDDALGDRLEIAMRDARSWTSRTACSWSPHAATSKSPPRCRDRLCTKSRAHAGTAGAAARPRPSAPCGRAGRRGLTALSCCACPALRSP